MFASRVRRTILALASLFIAASPGVAELGQPIIINVYNGGIWQNLAVGGWTYIGADCAALTFGADKLYCIGNQTIDIRKYQGSPQQWKWVGETAQALAADGDTLYVINRSAKDVWKIGTNTGSADFIGGGARDILVSGSTLFKVGYDNQVFHYTGTADRWTAIGAGFTQLAGTGGNLYAVGAQGHVSRYNGTPNQWTDLGGNASMLEVDGSAVYLIENGTFDIKQYSGQATNWTTIGAQGRDLLATGGKVYTINRSDAAIWQYDGRPNTWHQIGGDAGVFAHAGRTIPFHLNAPAVSLGLGLQYDDGSVPSVGIGSNNAVVEAHKAGHNSGLWYHVGVTTEGRIDWGASQSYDSGMQPSIAINSAGVVVEMHQTNSITNNSMYYHVGTLDLPGRKIGFDSSHSQDQGSAPSLALTNGNLVVEVHEGVGGNVNKIYYNVGTVDANAKTIQWMSGSGTFLDTGIQPSVTLDNAGNVVAAFADPAGLQMRVGQLNTAARTIQWQAKTTYEAAGAAEPAIALSEDGTLVALHQNADEKLFNRIGRLSLGRIIWSGLAPSRQFDTGQSASVAIRGNMTVQVHESDTLYSLYFSNALVADHADWMGASLPAFGNKNLRQIVAPASHDSGMYTGNILGRTQDLSIYDQLRAGIRYFDLRPDKNMYIYHGYTWVEGAKLADVLQDVRRFMAEGHRELVILKFGHYDGFDASVYDKFTKMITDGFALGPFLITSRPSGRFADQSLASLIGNEGKVLVVSDGGYPIDQPVPGIYVYRDCTASDPEKADLTVYDEYSNTTSFSTMKNGQLDDFNKFNGKCTANAAVQCDLFLLSWTLTPPTDVWLASQPANRELGSSMSQQQKNPLGFIPNLLYVDYVEYSRVGSVALWLNQRWK